MRRGVATADTVSAPTPTPARGVGRTASLIPDRLRSVDPLIAVVGLVSFVVYVLHGFDKALSRDLGVYTYAGQRFLDGDPPYVGLLNRAGPLAHVLPGVGIWLGRQVGITDIHGARMFFMLIAIACVCLVYVVVRDLTRSRSAAVVAATAFLAFQGFIEYATNGPREKTAMVMFLLAALLAVLHRRWATCGVLIALGTLTWQPVFFVIVPTAVAAALLARDRRINALARVILGGAATSAVVLLYYAVNGSVHTFFEGFLIINARYTTQPSPFSYPDYIWRSLNDGFGASLWVIILGLVASLVLGATSARAAWRSGDVGPVTHVGLGLGCLAGLIWSGTAFNAWPDLFVMLPYAAIGVGCVAAEGLRRLDLRIAVAVTCVVALVGTVYATVYSVTTRDDSLRQQQASIDAVLRTGPQRATILSLQAPEVLVMTHRTNASPYQMFDHGFSRYLDDTYPGGLAGYVAWIQRTAPTYIVIQTHHFKPPWLMPWLEDHYAQVGRTPWFKWYVTKSVDSSVRSEIREAHQAAVAEAGL